MATFEAVAKRPAHTIYKAKDGNRVPSVTTVLNTLAKPQLVKWANELGIEGQELSIYVDALAQIGTLAHHLIQCDLTGQSPDVRAYSQDQQDAAVQSIASWMAWRKVHTIEPILNEVPLVSEEYRYGGTLDLHARIDGVLTLADIKTAKAVYSEHKTQVIAYRQLLIENGHQVDAMQIIRVGREPGEGFEQIPVDKIAERWELFLACLRVYQTQKGL